MTKNEDRVWKLLEELIKSQKETGTRMKETDRSMKETARRMKETDRRIKETDRLVKELSKNIGGVNNSLGKIPEALSLPDIERGFAKFGIEVSEVFPNARAGYDIGRQKEVDVILVGELNNETIVVVVETQLRYKNNREIDEVVKFIRKDFKEIFRLYAPYKVVGCVCALGYGTAVDKHAMEEGFFVMEPVRGIMDIVNPKDFKPKWFI